MNKFIILIGFILIVPFKIFGQQEPHYTQFMFNTYLNNPAIAGTNNYYQITSNNRFQWVGIDEAPQTYSLTMHGPSAEKPMGWGGFIYNDVTGPTSKLEIGGSYSYNIALTDEIRISGGLSLGLMQYKFDGTKLNQEDIDGDPALRNVSQTNWLPDASVGFYMYSYNFYAGLSAHQLMGNKLSNIGSQSDTLSVYNRLKQHFYLTGGYRYILNRNLMLEPFIMLKYMYPAVPQVDISIKATYRNRQWGKKEVWGGITFRTGDAVALLVGYNHDNKYYVGLSYDYSFTDISSFNNFGTYEVMIGVRFDDIK